MRYFINFDKTVNQFVPHYLGGRKLILFLQSILVPLQQLNKEFSEWAKEKRIEASMTSQIFKLEWFLNRRFSKYFVNPVEKITIANAVRDGLPLYRQIANAPLSDNPALVKQTAHTVTDPVLYKVSERRDESSYSFIVNSPAINTSSISESEYIAQIQYWVDRYRTAGKTYKIKIN